MSKLIPSRNKTGNKPHFDVWCDFMECDFIDGAYIENFEKYYKQRND